METYRTVESQVSVHIAVDLFNKMFTYCFGSGFIFCHDSLDCRLSEVYSGIAGRGTQSIATCKVDLCEWGCRTVQGQGPQVYGQKKS